MPKAVRAATSLWPARDVEVWLRRRVRRGIDLLFGVFSSSEKSPPRRGHLLGQGGSLKIFEFSNSFLEPSPTLPKSQVPWSTGLCDCFDDVPNCNFHRFSDLVLNRYIEQRNGIDRSVSVSVSTDTYRDSVDTPAILNLSGISTCIRRGCITCWCPCITFERIAEIVDKGSTSCGASGALYTLISIVVGCPCFYSCFYRSKMRQQYLLHESLCGDCLVHCCCESCALCQEYRELKNRRFDMAIGIFFSPFSLSC
ncbi:hypothetical protein HYC85_023502 [Camellia sinensis]|uniref:Uncharacterized protein n=1 Tax=Camellia sinensis TaxID=4442 RepID=A0A7J7GES0_CAMSI|nr:hypothetical protein HYC85_023502 [Camellia sinensis]